MHQSPAVFRVRRAAGSALLAAVLILAAFTASGGVARAATMSWSGPVPLEASGGQPDLLFGMACPSSTQCTATTRDTGQEVTFNPQAPGTPTPITVDATGGQLSGLACPSLTQCTAVDFNGGAVTFNPQSPGGATSTVIYPGVGVNNGLHGVACPTTTQCTAVGSLSDIEVTFNPQSLSAATPVVIDPNGRFSGVACPSATQCTAVESNGNGGEVTFNPQSPGTPTPTTIESGQVLFGVACPSASQCTAVDLSGGEVTFNPQSPGSSTPATVDTQALYALACPLVSQCTAVDGSGQQVTFDPVSLGAPAPTTIDSGHVPFGIACPSASQCTAGDDAERVVTFDPMSDAGITTAAFSAGHKLLGLACPSPTQCTAIDDSGQELTFDPSDVGAPVPTPIDVGNGISAMACPSTTQCTVVDFAGNEVTFDPAAPLPPLPIAVDAGNALFSVACTSTTQCTAVDLAGNEVTFNPTAPGAPTPAPIDASGLVGVACPSVAQCTAIDESVREVTFDPVPPATVLYGGPALIDPTASNNPYGASLDGVACPSTTQCTAVDGNRPPPLGARSGEVSFNPQSPGSPDANPVDSGEFDTLNGPACPSARDCIAVDDRGNAVEGDPASPDSWRVVPIPGASSLNGVACTSVSECVAVDSVGNVFVGTKSTSTSLSCSPGSVAIGVVSTCTATVSDQGGPPLTAPSGRVSFSSDGSGSFSAPASCTLAASGIAAQASCQMSYTAAAVGSPRLTASYAGDESHPASGGSTSVGVTARSTASTVTCAPVSVRAGATTSCTVTVTDTVAATKSAPSGAVRFNSSGPGSFGGSGSCPLSADGSGTASCQLSYTPSATGSGSHRITASYGGDAVHAASSGQVAVGVTGSGAPVILRFGLTDLVFAVGPGSTPLTGTAASVRRHRRGTTFLYALSDSASVRIVIAQRLSGRRHGGRCVAPSRRLGGAGRCTRLIVRGTLKRTSHRGANRAAFSGRIGTRALKPGRYQATLTAISAAHTLSKPKTVRFVIVRR